MPKETEEKKFPIPGWPFEVRLIMQREAPPVLYVIVEGNKNKEHKDPQYADILKHFLHDIKTYISGSEFFPLQGRLTIDMYEADYLPLQIRYPGNPSPRYPISLVDSLIRNPIDNSRRAARNKKSSEQLFNLLSTQMPGFITDLARLFEQGRYMSDRKNHRPRTLSIVMDDETRQAYATLGFPPGTDWEVLKKSYREKARKAHPDTNGGVDTGAFQELQLAFDLIKKWHESQG